MIGERGELLMEMMTSNLFSRLVPSADPAARSIYDDLRAHDNASESDLEEHAGLAFDEENLRLHDDELGHENISYTGGSHVASESTAFLGRQPQQGVQPEPKDSPQSRRSRWVAQSPRLLEEEEDDDVPASLLIEDDAFVGPSSPQQGRRTSTKRGAPAIPGPSTREVQARWETAQAQQQLHHDEASAVPPPIHMKVRGLTGSPRDKAMYRWANVGNIDNFITDVYEYYIGAGIWCIILERVLSLGTLIFVAIFTTFLTQCVNYQDIPNNRRLSEVLVPQCTKEISGMPNVAIWLFALYVFWRLWQMLMDLPRLLRIRDFYLYLLEIPDTDMQTVSWQDTVGRIMALRDANPLTVENTSPAIRRKWMGAQSKQRLDAHDIANRLMRKENYFIALFNKEILDLTLPLPFLHGRQLFSRTLLWNLDWCIMDLVFNEFGQVRQLVLKDSHRKQLSDALRGRFLFAGFMNVIFAPVIVVYLMIVYFLRYFNEYQKNPSAIGSRQYTPLAEWKFREFNELHHLFHKRINMSYPFASRYLDQFPKVKMVQAARFVAFVSGAIVSVLALATLWDPEMFLSFEITHDRTALFYLGIFGPLWALMNGTVPDENLVFDPEYALRNVIEYTHYMPSKWEGRLHSDEVKRDFASLYQLKIAIFIEEVLSIIFTPFVLWFSLPNCSNQIIDFFREFTIHVDGVGYVCSFAVFDFKKGIAKTEHPGSTNNDLRGDYYATKHGKMAASYYGFLDNYLLNPKTGVPGHLPPGVRHQFQPPPAFPGLMSPTLAADMQSSRMGRSERRVPRVPPGAIPQPGRTPRFAPAAANASPMPSILLDPHHQPSTSGFGGRSVRRNSRSRYHVQQNIVEESTEDGHDPSLGLTARQKGKSRAPLESTGLEESKWETSGVNKDASEEETDDATGGGVLGLLYQFQKAQTDGRPSVNI